MFPVRDESHPSDKTPWVTIFLIALNVIILLILAFSGNPDAFISQYGIVPQNILQGKDLFTFLTSMFVHGGIIHLVSNMWYLWLFGDNIERRFGPIKFFLFYCFLGIASELTHVLLVSPEQANLPTIGASGAVSGILGSYIYLFPKNKIKTFTIFFFQPVFLSVPASAYIGIWFLYQLLYLGSPSVIAYAAHVGGFVAGLIFTFFFSRKNKSRNRF